VIQFLVDECLTLDLVRVAAECGYNAYHVTRRGWPSRCDAFLLGRILEEDLTLVTNNWKDFRPMLRREQVHPGAVVLPNVPLEEQVRLFRLELRAIELSQPPLDMVNTVVEVAGSGTVSVYEMPEP